MVQFLVFVVALSLIGGAVGVIVSTLRGSAELVLAALAGQPRVADVRVARRASVRRVRHLPSYSPQPLRAAA